MTTLLQISDLHLGGGYAARRATAVIHAATRLRPNAIILSGDLVDFAESQTGWRRLRELLDALPAPAMVIPGNHDVARFNLFDRLRDPAAAFRRHLGHGPDHTLQLPGVTLVGLGTPKRSTIDLGFLSRAQLAWAEQQLAGRAAPHWRVVVAHHPLRPFPSVYTFRRHMRFAPRTRTWLRHAPVDLWLSGHNHFPHTEMIENTIWHQAGTLGSARLPKRLVDTNTCSVLRLHHDRAEVQVWRFVNEAFEPGDTTSIARPTPIAQPSEVLKPAVGQ